VCVFVCVCVYRKLTNCTRNLSTVKVMKAPNPKSAWQKFSKVIPGKITISHVYVHTRYTRYTRATHATHALQTIHTRVTIESTFQNIVPSPDALTMQSETTCSASIRDECPRSVAMGSQLPLASLMTATSSVSNPSAIQHAGPVRGPDVRVRVCRRDRPDIERVIR